MKRTNIYQSKVVQYSLGLVLEPDFASINFLKMAGCIMIRMINEYVHLCLIMSISVVRSG